jgi:hypothetical protein
LSSFTAELKTQPHGIITRRMQDRNTKLAIRISSKMRIHVWMVNIRSEGERGGIEGKVLRELQKSLY